MNKKLGILGGGQLGKMLIQSASRYLNEISVLDSDPQAPCRNICHSFSIGNLMNYDDVLQFGRNCDILTIEIEKVNTQALKQLVKEGIEVYPQPEIIEMIQDKYLQKIFYTENNIPTADYVYIENNQAIADQIHFLPAVQKLARDGYDGKGVQILNSAKDLSKAFSERGILEKKIDIDKEISIIVSRSKNKEISVFPAVEMEFHPEANLVEFQITPAQISEEQEKEAAEIAVQIANKLNFIGILAVEMFIDKKGKIWVNEMAPRPHNSGHQSIEANFTSQYEQLTRILLNLPLGNSSLRTQAVMINLLGAEGFNGKAILEGVHEILSLSSVYLHWYGKSITKPYRKMGHVTIIGDNGPELKQKAIEVKNKIKIIS